jgi:hypothetical protein
MQKINFYLESRLAKIKKSAGDSVAKFGRDPAGAYKSALEYQVRYGRAGYRRYDSANNYSEAGDLFVDNLDGFNATPLQDIAPRTYQYTGYYSDNFQFDLVKPYIVKIKTSRGVFICPAIAYEECDGATIYFSRGQLAPNDPQDLAHDAAAYDCARIADHIAEQEAENARECDAQHQAEQEAEQLAEAIQEARQTARGLIAAIKAQRRAGIDLGGAICDALTDKLREYRREVIKARERRDALAENYWLSVEGY